MSFESRKEKLQQYKNELMTIDEDIAQLQEEFKQRQGEAAVLKVDLERAETTLHKANSSLTATENRGFSWCSRSFHVI